MLSLRYMEAAWDPRVDGTVPEGFRRLLPAWLLERTQRRLGVVREVLAHRLHQQLDRRRPKLSRPGGEGVGALVAVLVLT